MEEKNNTDVSWLISLIGDAHREARKLADQISRGTGGREMALCITKLEEARHWAVDALMLLQSKPVESEHGGPFQEAGK